MDAPSVLKLPTLTCMHTRVLEHALFPPSPNSPVKGLSVLEIKVLNEKFRCPRVESASDLHICHESPEESKKWFTIGGRNA